MVSALLLCPFNQSAFPVLILRHLPFQAVDRPVHRPLALLGVPDREEVQRAAGQPTEECEQGESGTDLKRKMGMGSIHLFGNILLRNYPNL